MHLRVDAGYNEEHKKGAEHRPNAGAKGDDDLAHGFEFADLHWHSPLGGNHGNMGHLKLSAELTYFRNLLESAWIHGYFIFRLRHNGHNE